MGSLGVHFSSKRGLDRGDGGSHRGWYLALGMKDAIVLIIYSFLLGKE
jgi:hypothetical protein